ncbi:MAG: hypothetical protein ACO36E_06760, partial [Synechocystis sp.]
YDPLAYRERTSGIFTEAIIAGRIPLVKANTWMASELAHYDLTPLILEWHDPVLVWQSVTAIAQNTEIRQKLMRMRQEYCELHCVSTYAQVFQQLADFPTALRGRIRDQG